MSQIQNSLHFSIGKNNTFMLIQTLLFYSFADENTKENINHGPEISFSASASTSSTWLFKFCSPTDFWGMNFPPTEWR